MNVWELAAHLLARHLAHGARLDALLETLPAETSAADRRRVRHLLYGAVRHRALLEFAVATHVPRRPRPVLQAALLLAAFELHETPASAPAIVHHAVDRARALTSPTEARLANAVLRRVPATLQSMVTAPANDAAGLALRHSHPEWLVARWLARWGTATTTRLLEWNQQPAPVHARWSPRSEADDRAATHPPASFRATPWPGFFRLDAPNWDEIAPLLAAGAIYLQDPATALAPALLAPAPGETLFDACAAPGGKTLQLAEGVGRTGRIVAADLAAPRVQRLRENIARHPSWRIDVRQADATRVTAAALGASGLPTEFDGVLADVPCSNTGVLRHRVDAKRRLRPDDLPKLTVLQLAILKNCAALVRPGGRIVYSTCSLEPEENESVVAQFLAATGGAFVLERSVARRPWEDECDGAGAFLLRRPARHSS